MRLPKGELDDNTDGEAQLVAQQFPVTKLLDFPYLKQAIMQWVGCTLEQHHQHFHSLTFSEVGHAFVFAQLFCDASQKWLLAERNDSENIINFEVLE